MRIGMIMDVHYPPHPRVKNEAINLIEEGHEVIVFCPNYTNLQKDEIVDGIRVIRYNAGKLLKKLFALSYTVSFYRFLVQRKIRSFIKDYHPEVLHVHNIGCAKAVLKASEKSNLTKVLDLHENIPEIMKMYHHVTHFPGNILIYPSRWKKWEKKLVQMYDKIIVVTEEAKEDLTENYSLPEEKILIIPNSVQPSFYESPKINEKLVKRFQDRFVLFYFGETGIRRGLETAIRSIQILKKEIPSILLVIVGQSKSDPYLKKITAKLNLQEYVVFEGFKNDALLQSYITASSVCISPLLRNIHHDTTYANKIFQYMALGKPQVVSDCPAQKRIIEQAKSGLIHTANSTDDFAIKILTLYKDTKLRESLGFNGADFIRNHYNQKIKSREMLKFYNSIS